MNDQDSVNLLPGLERKLQATMETYLPKIERTCCYGELHLRHTLQRCQNK